MEKVFNLKSLKFSCWWDPFWAQTFSPSPNKSFYIFDIQFNLPILAQGCTISPKIITDLTRYRPIVLELI